MNGPRLLEAKRRPRCQPEPEPDIRVNVVANLRARDLAYLTSVVDLDTGGYTRKGEVLDQLQQAWLASNDVLREPHAAMLVKTSWQENRDRAAERSRRSRA